MSQIEDFKSIAMSNPALRAELAPLAGKTRAEFIGGVSAVAARHGYALSEAEIAAAVDQQIASATGRDLNEEELDQVAAGTTFTDCFTKIENAHSTY